MSRADGDVRKSRRLLARLKPPPNSRRSSFVVRFPFIAGAEPLCTSGRSPGRVKLGDLRVSEDEIRILSFHVQLQRAFARWRIMEPFANSYAREITAGHVDRAAAMCQGGERRSLNSVRRPGGIDSPRSWQVFREQVENSRKAEWRPAANWAKGPSWVALDRRHERSAERLP